MPFVLIPFDSPYGGQTNDPASLQKYLYANGNPENGWDPTGHFFDMISLISALGIRGMKEGESGAAASPAMGFARSVNAAMKFVNGIESTWDTLATLTDYTRLADLTGVERAAFTGALAGLASLGAHIGLRTVKIPVPVTLVNKLKRKVGPLWDTSAMQGLLGAAVAALATTILGWKTTDMSADYTGVDAIMNTGKLGYAVVEAKGGASKLGETADGRQMYDKWIRTRIQRAIAKNPGSMDATALRFQKAGLAVVFKTDLTGPNPYFAFKVESWPGVKSWGGERRSNE